MVLESKGINSKQIILLYLRSFSHIFYIEHRQNLISDWSGLVWIDVSN